MQSLGDEIKSLDGKSNYSDWAFQVKMVLINRGLWGTIEPSPNKVITEDMKWSALSFIRSNVKKFNCCLVNDAVDALDAWNRLKGAFNDSDTLSKIGLLRQLTGVSLSDCDSIENYVDKLLLTAQALNNAGLKVDDEWLAALFLRGLTDKYESLISSLEASGVKLTTDLVKSNLIQDVTQDVDVRAFHAQPKRRKRQRNNKKKDQTVTSSKTVKKMKDFEPKGECKKLEDESIFAMGAFNLDQRRRNACSGKMIFMHALGSMVKAGSPDSNNWYFDCNATNHMTSHREWFSKDFKQVEGTIVTAAGQGLKVFGSGAVKIKSKQENCLSVKQVKFVPGLKTNLFSVNQIVDKGNTVIFHKRECRVVGVNGEVLATRSLTNGLFKLNQTLLNNTADYFNQGTNTKGRPEIPVLIETG